MSSLLNPTRADLQKWRLEANRIAELLKRNPPLPKAGEDYAVVGIVFNDAVARVELNPAELEKWTEKELADFLHDTVLTEAALLREPKGNA